MKIRLRYILTTIALFVILITITGSFLYQQLAVNTSANAKEILYPKSMLPIFLSETMVLPMIELNNRMINEYDNDETDLNYLSIDQIEQIHNESIHLSYLEEDKQYTIHIGDRTFTHIYGTDVGNEGNRVFPMRSGIINDEVDFQSALISSDFLKYGLGYQTLPVTIRSGQHIYFTETDNELYGMEQIPTEGIHPVQDWENDKRLKYLENLINPIAGSHVSTWPSQWPGAPRSYRNGYHEGLDFYTHTSGVVVDKDTPVLSMDDGIVIRSDYDYLELTEEYRREILDISANRSSTPEYILDMLRGKSVWIQHRNGIVARYVHLDSIESDVRVGSYITQGQVIGKTGNTGTSQGLEGSNDGVHLHLDIFIYGQLFWEEMNTEEIVDLLQTLFNE